MRDYIDRQGSYRRPGLLMLGGQIFGANAGDLVLPAAAKQLSEDWILMQDDAADNSEFGGASLPRTRSMAGSTPSTPPTRATWPCGACSRITSLKGA